LKQLLSLLNNKAKIDAKYIEDLDKILYYRKLRRWRDFNTEVGNRLKDKIRIKKYHNYLKTHHFTEWKIHF